MSPKRILVVDDEPEVLELLEAILVRRGYVVDSATSASGAIELVREKIFDAAILDFNLPDMNGVMLHRQIRQMDEELADHTLFTSGLMQSESNLDYYTAHGKGFLAKPFDVRSVLESVSGLFDPSEGT